MIYIREAHPIDGSWPGTKEVEDPISDEERQQVASDFVKELGLTMPVLLDRIDDKVNRAYAGWPDRLYLVNKAGKIAYAGGPGPSGFKPDELRQAIQQELGQTSR